LENTRRRLRETRQELGSVSEKLLSKDANLVDLDKRRIELEQRQNQLEQELTTQGAALTESEKARANAELRAQAAIASLMELAQVREEANETIVTLSGAVLFKTGQSDLLPLAKTSLDRVAIALKELDESQMIVIKGHTDSRGAEVMNRNLSQARADSVRNYLISQGVSGKRLEATGKGESEPIADNGNAEGRANNRRVEIVIGKPNYSASR
jgi:outer membrane protein OmpA-like peptidoglycan-associated protein